MSIHQLDSNHLPKYFLLILHHLITGSLSNFGAIDILAPQWIYLGAINTIELSLLLFVPQMR